MSKPTKKQAEQQPSEQAPSTLTTQEYTRRSFLFTLANISGLVALGFGEAQAAQDSMATPGNEPATPKTPAPAAVAPKDGLKFAPAKPFSYKSLIARAEEMAKNPYQAPPSPAADAIKTINYDASGKIKFNPQDALWGKTGSVYPITF
ncbi:glucan biosynthesis protein, partial [Halothiobacillus sp.]|uniref:glucan biosynthesis protein n=1 Tax=Halothiobacillus sp. TaxID=1891311 RepID=UPI003D09DBD9